MSFSADLTIRLVVFDCDGTLVDSQSLIVAAMTRAFQHLDMPPPEPVEIRRVVGLSLETACTRLLPGAEQDQARALAHAYRSAFIELRSSDEEEPLFPGAVAALDGLDEAGFLLGIATGKSLRGLERTLGRHGLNGRFATLQTADHAPSKPHPGMLHRAMEAVGADRNGTVFVGDTSYDMAMAANARVRAIGVSWGYHEVDELVRAGAERIVDDFAALSAALLGEGAA